MELLLVITAALVPVAIALWYIKHKDAVQPEPTKWLFKAFGYGILSTLVALILAEIMGGIFGIEDSDSETSVIGAFLNAFCSAAIPEEIAKYLMLLLLIRKNPHFDEKFDGIVYAVFISMGFAGLENIMYLIEGLEDGSWLGTGVARALFSIPGHFLFAVLMGYYYSLYRFGIDNSMKTRVMILGAPILAHGIYDGILFSMSVSDEFSAIAMILFLYFFNKLRKKGKKRINELMESRDLTTPLAEGRKE